MQSVEVIHINVGVRDVGGKEKARRSGVAQW
jgi:hypothetical protein